MGGSQDEAENHNGSRFGSRWLCRSSAAKEKAEDASLKEQLKAHYKLASLSGSDSRLKGERYGPLKSRHGPVVAIARRTKHVQ